MERIPILFSSQSRVITELYRRVEEMLIKISYLGDVKEVASKFHQKIFNKRFFDALKLQNPFLYGSIELQNNGCHKLHVMTSNIQSYYRNDLLNIYSCESHKILVNNRLNADALNQFVDGMIDSLWKHHDKLWADIRTGEDRLHQYNALVTQLNELKNTFSSDFVSLRNLDFKVAYRL